MECELVNSCVRYIAEPGWTNFDLMTTFPPLENTQVTYGPVDALFRTPRAFQSPTTPRRRSSEAPTLYYPFHLEESELTKNAPSLIVPVYAVVKLCETKKLTAIPYFLARVGKPAASHVFILALELSLVRKHPCVSFPMASTYTIERSCIRERSRTYDPVCRVCWRY